MLIFIAFYKIHMNMKIIRECIVVGGRASGGHVLGKTRDRNYSPRVNIVRELTDDGIEIVYMHDLDTDYMEGMNSNGIGVVNAALLVGKDEKAVKGKVTSDDGPRMMNALRKKKLSDVIKSLVSFKDGIKGHTLVASPKSMYTIELTSKNNPIVKKVDPGNGYTVRTNHGIDHPDAGYTPKRKPEDYLSSKIRKASAQVAISDEDDYKKIMPKIATQQFEPESNMNMLRRTDNMRSASQVMMHLDDLVFNCYIFPNECKFKGMIDNTPDDYDPRIKVNILKYKDR